jgi:ribosome-associated toxin RatA of RatAB toxin-antitoxin module
MEDGQMTTTTITRLARFGSLSAFALVTALSLAPVAAADTYAPPATDAQAVKLAKLNKEAKSNYAMKDSKFKVARAEIFINAPMAQVKSSVMDYANYSSFIPKFQKSKVIKGKAGEAQEVFLQIPILHGAATIWAVENFALPAADGKTGEKIVGNMVKGNVDDLRATWRYRAVDDKHTVLSLDIYIAPKIAAPESVVTAEVEDACGDGVRAVKERAEAAAKKVASAKP